MHMLHWCMQSMMHYSHCDRVETLLLTITANGLWPVIMQTSFMKQNWWNFSNTSSMTKVSHSMLLYHNYVLEKLLLANVMGHSAVLSEISSHQQFMPPLTCNMPAPRLTLSVSRFKGFNAP